MQKSSCFLKYKYALAVGLTTLLAAPVQAANRYVTNANDSGSGSLRAVVAAAANDDTVIINANVGQITLTSGQIDILKNLTIKGGGSSRAVISGNNLSRIFASKITNRTLTLENLHLKNGQTTAPSNTTEDCFTTDGRGGAVCANSKLVIKNSQFSHNKTTGDKAHGGAVYAAQKLTVSSSFFEGNKAEHNYANSGAIHNSEPTAESTISSTIFTGNMSGKNAGAASMVNVKIDNSGFLSNIANQGGTYGYGGALYINGQLTLLNSELQSNKAPWSAGAIYIDSNTDFTITNTNFKTNESNGGGAIYIKRTGESTITGGTFEGNKATSGYGGAVYNYSSTMLTIDGSAFTTNQATSNGGALYLSSSSTVKNITATGNTAGYDGGAIASYRTQISNSYFKNNTAEKNGGAVSGNVWDTKINSSYFEANTAKQKGGAISSIGTLSNSIVKGNHTTDNKGQGGGVYAGHYSVITNSIIENNYTLGQNAHGGGVAYAKTIENSTVSNNYTSGSAAYGGGVYYTEKIINTTVANNETRGPSSLGGGVHAPYDIKISNSTIANNSTIYVQSGGVYVARKLTLTSSILSGNNQSGVANNCELSSSASIIPTYSLVSNSGQYACGITANSSNHNIVGSNAQLSTLADNGCAVKAGNTGNKACVKTMKPQSSSAVLNAGTADSSLTTDQRGSGYDRVSDSVADIGAFETQVQTFTVGGSVSGLSGTLELSNGTETKTLTSNTSFSFNGYTAGASYTINVSSNPTEQTCTISNASGTVSADINNINVVCTTNQYTVGGSVSGLSGTLKLSNGSQTKTLTSNTSFSFDSYTAGASYTVSISSNPAEQTCTISNSSGTVNADINNINVVCTTNRYTVGGSVSGLSGTLKISNGTETKTLTSNTTFSFSGYTAGENYTISVSSKPSVQNCRVDNGSGTVSGVVTNVKIVCFTPQFQVKGSVSGLSGTLKLSNGKETKTVTKNTSFAFNGYKRGDKYHITVVSQPSNQTCTLSKGSGTISGNVTNVTISCADNQKYSVGGHIAMEKGDTITISNGKETKFFDKTECFFCGLPFLFTFGDYKSGESYEIKISQYPENQTCTLSHAKGRVTKDIDNVVITCAKKGIIFNDGFE